MVKMLELSRGFKIKNEMIEIEGRTFKIADTHIGESESQLRTFSLIGANGAHYSAHEIYSNRGVFQILKLTGKIGHPFPSTYLRINETGMVEVVN